MRLRRRFAAIVSILAVLVGVAVVSTPAGAQEDSVPDLGPDTTLINERPNGKLVVETPIGRIYGNLPGEAPDGLFVITGSTIEQACTNVPPLHRMVLVPQANGKWTVKTPAGGTQVLAYVYDTDLDGDSFFGAMCGGLFEDGTPPLAPLAVGMVTLENRDRNIADITTALSGTGPFAASLNNSITGLVSDRDGNVFELDARFKGKLRTSGAVSCTGDCSVTLTPAAA